MGPPILWRDPASGKDHGVAVHFPRARRGDAGLAQDLRVGRRVTCEIFLAALTRALPNLSPPEVCWALHFTDALPHQCTDTNFRRLKALSDGGCDTEDVASVLDRAVRYAIGGIEAFAATARDRKTTRAS